MSLHITLSSNQSKSLADRYNDVAKPEHHIKAGDAITLFTENDKDFLLRHPSMQICVPQAKTRTGTMAYIIVSRWQVTVSEKPEADKTGDAPLADRPGPPAVDETGDEGDLA